MQGFVYTDAIQTKKQLPPPQILIINIIVHHGCTGNIDFVVKMYPCFCLLNSISVRRERERERMNALIRGLMYAVHVDKSH